MQRIVIIEDDAVIRQELAKHFAGQGYEAAAPEPPFCGEPAKGADLILLDINLGEQDGFELCRKIRGRSKVPVIFVTSRESEEDELRAILLGGDDFIRKPYSLPVLTARVMRLLKRSEGNAEEITAGEVRLNLVFGRLEYGEQILELSKKEQQILYYLMLNQGRIVSGDDLIEYLWNNKLYVDENILNVNLSRLRKRLAEIGMKDFIRTIPKEGYAAGMAEPAGTGVKKI